MYYIRAHKLEVFLFALSVLLLVSFYSGLLEKEFDLLDSKSVHKYTFKSPDGIEGGAEFSNNILSFTCVRPDSKVKITCGTQLVMTGDPKNGVDFSTYDYIDIQAHTESPAAENRLRIAFKNFHKNYSYLDDDFTYKVNAFLSQKLVGPTQRIPLGLLRVQQWWLRMFKIPLEDSLPDISNVVTIDFLAMQTGPEGVYETQITEASMHGTYLSESEVMAFVIVCALLITVLMFRQAQLSNSIATTDSLTGLMNRAGMQKWIESLNPSKQRPVNTYLFFIDVDDFKKVNDTHGHKVGDDLLAYLSAELLRYLCTLKLPRRTWSYIRLSGDEFLIIFTDIDDAQAHAIAKSVIEHVCKRICLYEVNIDNQISLGVASQALTSPDLRQLIEKADSAMYVAKKNGKSQYHFYDEIGA